MITFSEYKHLRKLLEREGWKHDYSIMDAYGTGGGYYSKGYETFFWNSKITPEDIRNLIKSN